MISKRDSRPFLIKFPIGTSKNDKSEKVYSQEWNVVYGLKSDPRGTIRENVYGNNLAFDKIIILNAGSLTRKIDYDTAILLDNMPTSVYDKGDYKVSYIYPERNNEIVIGLNKKEGVSIPKLYFINEEQVLYTQMNFDKTTLKAYADKKQHIPFSLGQDVWTRTPQDEFTMEHRLSVTSIKDTGFDKNSKNFVEITFSE